MSYAFFYSWLSWCFLISSLVRNPFFSCKLFSWPKSSKHRSHMWLKILRIPSRSPRNCTVSQINRGEKGIAIRYYLIQDRDVSAFSKFWINAKNMSWNVVNVGQDHVVDCRKAKIIRKPSFYSYRMTLLPIFEALLFEDELNSRLRDGHKHCAGVVRYDKENQKRQAERNIAG